MHHGGLSDMTDREVDEEVRHPDQEDEYLTGVIVGCKTLPIYDIPLKQGDVLLTLKAGTKVDVDPQFRCNRYHAVVTQDGTEGYCECRYIRLEV